MRKNEGGMPVVVLVGDGVFLELVGVDCRVSVFYGTASSIC